MEFGAWLAYYPVGRDDTLLSRTWGMENPWHKAVAQLLKDSPVVTREKAFARPC